jgi:uncharacterized protein YndB with AHSA1/START domain
MPNVTAIAEYRFATLSPRRVYDAWLDPVLVRRWMTRNLEASPVASEVTGVDIDPRKGGKFCFSGLQDGKPSDSWGYYRELDPGRRLVFTWFIEPDEEREDNSTVTLELEPDGSDTRATLAHEMDARWTEYVAQTAEAWRGMLKAIDETLVR